MAEQEFLPQSDTEITAPLPNWAGIKGELIKWRDSLQHRAEVNSTVARRTRRVSQTLSAIDVIVGVVTGTSVFIALRQKDSTTTTQLVITGLAILPAISSGLQRALHLAGREEYHIGVSNESLALSKRIDFLLIAPSSGNLRPVIESLHSQYVEVMQRPPFR
ncbi:MAG TPA: hypothetical protein VHZ07_06805 [Bryobacteraceae bacterium]|jgi:hypothetical protein|nr:hypothetical protein [Bryobacteraceae bacterium]